MRKIILFSIVVIIVLIILYFQLPSSPLQTTFEREVTEFSIASGSDNSKIFQRNDFETFPLPIQRYMDNANFIGKKRMQSVHFVFTNVVFYQNHARKLRIDYDQYNFGNSLSRLAKIDSSLFGIPFEGYDYLKEGRGGMVGVLGKQMLLFHETGPDMDRGALCTYLGECLFLPTTLLSGQITFTPIDDYHVEGTLTHEDVTLRGIFTFNEDYELVKFYTEDRAMVNGDGSVEYVPWSFTITECKTSPEGIRYPAYMQSKWHEEEGDFLYFDGAVQKIEYN